MSKEFIDARGIIREITNETIETEGIQYIYSNADARRAGHYHKLSGHHCILTRGSLVYYERPVGDKGTPTQLKITTPAIFYTGPQIEHLMVFLEDSEMLCLRTNGSKNHEDYENDLVRLDFELDKV